MSNTIKILQNEYCDDDEDDYNDADDGDGIVILLLQCIYHLTFILIILIQILLRYVLVLSTCPAQLLFYKFIFLSCR